MNTIGKLKGFVDRADKMLLSGWALSEGDPAHRPEVQIVQDEQVVVTITPAFPAPQLRGKLGLEDSTVPPLYNWRLWLPLTCGLKPEVAFSVEFRASRQPLEKGGSRVIAVAEGFDAEALDDLTRSSMLVPHIRVTEDQVVGHLGLSAPAQGARPALQIGDWRRELDEITWVEAADRTGVSKRVAHHPFCVNKLDILSHGERYLPVSLVPDAQESGVSERLRVHAGIRTLALPKTLFDPERLVCGVPDVDNIHRVGGPRANKQTYLYGGMTTFVQLDKITTEFVGRRITEFDTVVDWGVGCGRVARHFWESPVSGLPSNPSQTFIGVDIDAVNVDWCRRNLADHGDFSLLSLEGFDLPDSSVDLLYGISVMTHLSEYHQHLWLREISRILRPGGCAILTTHGETAYANPTLIALPFVDKFGFFDGMADAAIGSDMDTYYRSTFHARWYVREQWSRYFDILDIIPAANAFLQDFVVVRKAW